MSPEVQIEQISPLPYPLVQRTNVPHVRIVIPVFNEEGVIEQTFDKLRAELDASGGPWSVVFVNDGSSDGTIGVLESLYQQDERVVYLVLSRNFGHQAALTAGLDHPLGQVDVVVTMDADLQHPPEMIATLVTAWRMGYDVVHTRKLSTDDQAIARSATTRVAYALIRRVAQVDIIPQASDFRLLDREALEALQDLPERSRLLRGLIPWVGFRQAVVPFRAPSRANGGSRYGLRQLIQLFARSLFDFSSAPLLAAFVVGAGVLALCGAYLLYVGVSYLFGSSVPRGFVPLIFTVVLLGAVNLTFTGILGVYLARIYDEVRARPTYVLGRVRGRLESATETGTSRSVGSHQGSSADLQRL